MSFLVPGVFRHVVKIFATDDERSVHFRRDNGAGQDSSSDRDQAGEGAFLVCITRGVISNSVPETDVLESYEPI